MVVSGEPWCVVTSPGQEYSRESPRRQIFLQHLEQRYGFLMLRQPCLGCLYLI